MKIQIASDIHLEHIKHQMPPRGSVRPSRGQGLARPCRRYRIWDRRVRFRQERNGNFSGYLQSTGESRALHLYMFGEGSGVSSGTRLNKEYRSKGLYYLNGEFVEM